MQSSKGTAARSRFGTVADVLQVVTAPATIKYAFSFIFSLVGTAVSVILSAPRWVTPLILVALFGMVVTLWWGIERSLLARRQRRGHASPQVHEPPEPLPAFTLSFSDPERRIIDLVVSFGRDLSSHDLTHYTGLARETVDTVVASLEHKGVVEVRNGQVHNLAIDSAVHGHTANDVTLGTGFTRGYARQSLPDWWADYISVDGQVRCSIHGYPKQVLRDCTVTAPDGFVGVARPSPREPQGHYAFTYPEEFEYARKELPLADGEYRVEWTAVGDSLIRVAAFHIRDGVLANP